MLNIGAAAFFLVGCLNIFLLVWWEVFRKFSDIVDMLDVHVAVTIIQATLQLKMSYSYLSRSKSLASYRKRLGQNMVYDMRVPIH